MASSTSAPPCAGGALSVRPMSRSGHARAERTGLGASLLAFCLTFIIAALAVLAPAEAAPQNREPVRAQVTARVTADVSGGYARLVFVLSNEAEASVHSAGNILIISFDRPVYLSVEHLVTQASQYIAAARRDPDGRSVRFALAQKVNVNSIETADKFFVDLLPATWDGPPPPLPHEVVEELARRAREAEHLQHMAQLAEQRRKATPVRVHMASHPTFTRYVFDIPEQTSVSADRAKERLTLSFDAPLAFDLTDAEADLPPVVASINAETEQDLSLVRFSFMAPVDLRTFRDGKSYVVDIVKGEASTAPRNSALGKPMPMVNMEATPQSSVTAESMTVPPAAAARAAASPQAPTSEKPVVAPREDIAAPAAPQEQTPESQ